MEDSGKRHVTVSADDEEISVCDDSDSSESDSDNVRQNIKGQNIYMSSGILTSISSLNEAMNCNRLENVTHDNADLNNTSVNCSSELDAKSSKEQRAKVNLRERKRMHDLNEAMESLREVMPYGSGPTVRKLSKIATLSLARNYILMLNRTVSELKQKLDEVYRTQRADSNINRRKSTGINPYLVPHVSNHSNTMTKFDYDMLHVRNPSHLRHDPIPIQYSHRSRYTQHSDVNCQCCLTSRNVSTLGLFNTNT